MAQPVPAQAHALRRELRLADLVLYQVLYVLGPVSIGTAALFGPGHALMWLVAILIFLLPQAVLVVHLSARWPFEGGLYQWVKLGYGEKLGFLTGWNLWLSNLCVVSYAGSTIVSHAAYGFGSRWAWMAEHKGLNLAVSAAMLALVGSLAARGLGVSKWLHNAGALSLLLCYGLLASLPWASPSPHGVALAWPVFSLATLNLLTKLTVPALFGLDEAAVLAGECVDPARHLARATPIAGVIISLAFLLGTNGVLAFTPSKEVDLAAPMPQALAAASRQLGWTLPLLPAACVGLIAYWLGAASASFSSVVRLPMTAGWDHLLPEWMTRLHARWRTPVYSIWFSACAALAVQCYAQLGAGHQEVFQLLVSQSVVFSALAYLPMFALPWREKSRHTALLAAGGLGFASTALYVVMAVYPIVEVRSPAVYAIKLGTLIGLMNVAGLGLYRLGRQTLR